VASPQILTFYEATFWMSGSYPTPKEVKEKFNLTSAHFKEEYETLNAPLSQRGLPDLPPILEAVPLTFKKEGTLPKKQSDLDPTFVLAVNLICATTDKRSTAAKLKAISVTPQKWQGFLKSEKNRNYFEKRLDEAFGQVEYAAKLALARNVESGDLQSIKHYQEYTGRFRPNSETEVNIGLLLAKLMEILTKYLAPPMMAQVADEFEQIINVPSKELTA